MSTSPRDGYIEVKDRLPKFYERFPEGSLQGDYEVIEIGGDTLIVYRAEAYRHAEDERPGVGIASEPYPGKTSFTRGSEVMNAETSAWGRAMASLGIEVHQGIASANEVRQAEARREGEDRKPPSAKQVDFLNTLLERKARGVDTSALIPWAQATLSGGRDGSMSTLIDAVNQGDQDYLAQAVAAADKWAAEQSDVPADATDLPDPAEREGEGTLL